MRYYVVADPHGFCTLLRNKLEEMGFFSDPEPHKLVICGDYLDRGAEPLEMQAFLLELMARDEVILVRGNHEDLLERLVDDLITENTWLLEQGESVHNHNGTWMSVLRLTGMTEGRALSRPVELASKIKQTPFWKYILPSTVDFFETEHYVFTHGWIPCTTSAGSAKYAPYKSFSYDPDWRQADYEAWSYARWYNGMDFACRQGVTVPGKTVVCGHKRASYGHATFEEHADPPAAADYSPFYGKGIIAMDACTVLSGTVNCLILED